MLVQELIGTSEIYSGTICCLETNFILICKLFLFNLTYLIIFFQYDFETETTFLTWLQTKKKNDAEKEAAKQAALTSQREAAEAVAAKQSQQQTPASSQPVSTTTTNNSVSPVMSGLGQDILMPTQLHSGAPTTTTQTVPPPKVKSQTSFDPRDFENNAFDPFEMTELQTLNDMDELRAVLGNSIPQQQEGSSEQTNQQQQQQGAAQNHLSSAVSANNETVNDASPSEPEYQNIQKQADYQNVPQHDGGQAESEEDSSQRHEYQNVQIESRSGLVMFKPDKPGNPPLPPRNVDQTASNGALSPGLMPNGIGDMPEGTEKASTMNLTFPSRTPLPPITPSSSRENTQVSIGASNSDNSASVGVSSPQPTATPEMPELPARSGPSPRSRSPPPSYYAPDYGRRNPAAPMAGAVPLPGLPPDPPPSYPQVITLHLIISDV